jgi:arsenate reductase
MAEAGVDISGQTSDRLSDLPERGLGDRAFDDVVTVCSHAHETCPLFPGGARVVHVGFDDPPRLAAGSADEEEALGHYRRVRDEIRAFVERLPAALDEAAGGGRG